MRRFLLGLLVITGGVPAAYCESHLMLSAEVRMVAIAVGVPPSIAEALVERESGFNPLANTPEEGSEGIMQLQARYLLYFAARYNDGHLIDPFDPHVAIRVGLRYLADLHRQTGDWFDALAAYNAGPNRIAVGDYPASTVTYVRWILERAREYRSTDRQSVAVPRHIPLNFLPISSGG